MVKVAVKWNKRVFEDVEVAANVIDFKTKLQELTVRMVAYRAKRSQASTCPCEDDAAA